MLSHASTVTTCRRCKERLRRGKQEGVANRERSAAEGAVLREKAKSEQKKAESEKEEAKSAAEKKK